MRYKFCDICKNRSAYCEVSRVELHYGSCDEIVAFCEERNYKNKVSLKTMIFPLYNLKEFYPENYIIKTSKEIK